MLSWQKLITILSNCHFCCTVQHNNHWQSCFLNVSSRFVLIIICAKLSKNLIRFGNKIYWPKTVYINWICLFCQHAAILFIIDFVSLQLETANKLKHFCFFFSIKHKFYLLTPMSSSKDARRKHLKGFTYVHSMYCIIRSYVRLNVSHLLGTFFCSLL